MQVRHALYKVKTQPDSPLHPTFKARLFDIAANIQNNNTNYAHYLSELLVRDYGTHFVTSVEAGAVLSQVDHINSELFTTYDFSKQSVTASAGGNFFGQVSLGASFNYATSEENQEGYLKNRTSSEIFSWGGPPFRPNFTITEWENGVRNALVAIDRSGDPLHFAITPSVLPEMPESTIKEVAKFVFKAIKLYYKVNTRHGCTDPHSPNFDFQANVNDSSCTPENTNFSFGGIFQTCEHTPWTTEDLCFGGPEPVNQVNPLTGETNCPSKYIPILLHSGNYSHPTTKQVCHRSCSFLFFNCHTTCATVPGGVSIVNYKAYWCAALGRVERNSGYLFGGYYTSTTANPFTGTPTCPRYFFPLHFGEDTQICVSDDYELGEPYSVPFAGFESCIAGNPLASKNKSLSNAAHWLHSCPYSYSQHLVTIDEGCEINFCIKSGAFNQLTLQPPRLPPFRRNPELNPNSSEVLVVIGNYGGLWYKDQDGIWVLDNETVPSGKDFLSVLDSAVNPSSPVPRAGPGSKSNSLSNGAVAAVSVTSTTALSTLIAVVVFASFFIIRKRKLSSNKGDGAYISINEDNGPTQMSNC